MHSKHQYFTNFSRAIHTHSNATRPIHEPQLEKISIINHPAGLLARGRGLSYSDCCVLNTGDIIDTSRLNHILEFDLNSGIVVCQPAVTFADLFLVHPEFIPPVFPGTLHATLGGGVANDIHGKNHHHASSLHAHIQWLEVMVNGHIYRCSLDENYDLFTATIAGIGLTGIITRIALRLRKASRIVNQTNIRITSIAALLEYMQTIGIKHDYQVAWLDMHASSTRAVLSLANHIDNSSKRLNNPNLSRYTIPKRLPRCIYNWNIKQFNRIHYYTTQTHTKTLPLWQFNNPLDDINHWPRLYGKHGLLQFQAIIPTDKAPNLLHRLHTCMRKHKAYATLAVLKYFTHSSIGLLAFSQPGFNIAFDFINTKNARLVIDTMNQLILNEGGHVYLAKDLRLTKAQFIHMYPQHQAFKDILTHYKSPMSSDLSKRLGITL